MCHCSISSAQSADWLCALTYELAGTVKCGCADHKLPERTVLIGCFGGLRSWCCLLPDIHTKRTTELCLRVDFTCHSTLLWTNVTVMLTETTIITARRAGFVGLSPLSLQSALTKAAESLIQYMNRAHRRRLTYKLITEMPLEVLMKPTIRSQNTITCPSSRQKCWSLTRKKKIHAKSERRVHCLVSAHISSVVIDNDHQIIIIIILIIILEICTARKQIISTTRFTIVS